MQARREIRAMVVAQREQCETCLMKRIYCLKTSKNRKLMTLEKKNKDLRIFKHSNDQNSLIFKTFSISLKKCFIRKFRSLSLLIAFNRSWENLKRQNLRAKTATTRSSKSLQKKRKNKPTKGTSRINTISLRRDINTSGKNTLRFSSHGSQGPSLSSLCSMSENS